MTGETPVLLFRIFQSIQPLFNLHEFMNDNDVRLLGINADGAIVAMNKLLDFTVGFFGDVHGLSHV